MNESLRSTVIAVRTAIRICWPFFGLHDEEAERAAWRELSGEIPNFRPLNSMFETEKEPDPSSRAEN